MLPEIAALDSRSGMIRIPPEVDVPLTGRVRRLIDTPEFQRLANIHQLGLVRRVYPGATHSRFEHSLGVFRLAVILLKRFAHDERFAATVSDQAAALFLVSALLHDLGHYPYCHPVEDLRLPGTLPHEKAIQRYLLDPDGEIFHRIRDDWELDPADVLFLLGGETPDHATFLTEHPTLWKLLSSLLSGPVDIDKMDYLQRDSIHAGVPYGRNFDQERLLGSLCLNATGDGLAISSKGKTAAELMVFARYVMFSEVYWHHAVRSATAMLQRLYFDLWKTHGDMFAHKLVHTTDDGATTLFRQFLDDRPARVFYDGLFGSQRLLYKQAAEFAFFEYPEIYHQLARRPYDWLVEYSTLLAERISRKTGVHVAPTDLIIDAPPVEREVEFVVNIYDAKENRYQAFADVSPVVKALAVEQFDDFVKRVRIFIHPRHRNLLPRDGWISLLLEN
ncbi:MAG: HD domain-containing protein [Planctomycetia bacterium]|nr:HD domain-containing protein [Planctomycetia bacterium]